MSDFENKLNRILSSPEDMKKIMNLANSLSSNENSGPGQPHGDHENNSGEQFSQGAGPGDEGTNNPLGDIDPRILKILSKVMSSGAASSSRTEALIGAITPYLKSERQDKLRRAVQIAKFAKIARIAMSEFGGGDFNI